MAGRRQAPKPAVEWNFFSFPVAYAFAAGGFVGMVLCLVGISILFYAFLFAFSFGNAHIVGQWFRRRTLDRRRERDEEAERERRALAARSAASLEGEASSARRRRRRRGS
ncbi:MAG TPA: hypothetical protein VJB57_13860 [Dehalococcoidia bacterium]|nr:hypothetical protein [Dehalococcoidia bacterium]